MKTQLHQYLTINLVVIYFADVAREEARKMETAVLVPGTLVQVNRLTNSSSSHGTALNEHYGIVRGTAAADGFLTVEIILGDQGEEADRDRCVDPGTLVSVKPFNLDFIARPDGGYHLLQLYLMNKARSILQKGEIGIHMFESWLNKFAVPGFPPEMHRRAKMSGLLRFVGTFEEAIVIAKKCLPAISPSSPDHWNQFY